MAPVKLDALNGIRALASLLIVLHHCFWLWGGVVPEAVTAAAIQERLWVRYMWTKE